MRDFLMSLVECSASMSVFALGLIVLTPLLSKRYASKWLYYSWLVIVAGLIIPFRFHFHTVLIRIDAAPSSTQQVFHGNIEKVADTTVQINAANHIISTIQWYQIVGILWLVGVAAFLIYHILRHYRFTRMVIRWGEHTDNPSMLEILEKIKSDMGISIQVKLMICSCVSSPMMLGFLNPVILLPRSDFTADELPYILRHELVHFKRKDLWYKSLMVFATAIHWFNPVIYLMVKAIMSQCEISCDAEVVNETGMDVRQRYSETIIGVIKNQSRMETVLSTNFYGGKKNMKKRIYAIMDARQKKASFVLLCALLVGVMVSGVAFAAASIDDNVAIGTLISDISGNVSTDGGQTWISEEEYQKLYSGNTFSNVEWYTYDEYKAFVEEQKETLPNYIGATGGYYDGDGVLHEEVWTQEKIDETLADYEKILEDIKNGAKISKSVNGDDSIMMGSSTPKLNLSKSSTATLTLKNGEIIDFGTYDTKEECLAAIKAYCDEQVKSGNLTQQEADDILTRYK